MVCDSEGALKCKAKMREEAAVRVDSEPEGFLNPVKYVFKIKCTWD